MLEVNKIYCGDCRELIGQVDDESVDCIITSPPYFGLRDYGVDKQLGLEPTFQLYLNHLMQIMAECKRVLKKTGTMWINIGDSYAGNGKRGGGDPTIKNRNIGGDYPIKPKHDGIENKSLIGIPERFTIAMTDELGMIRRNTIIWYKRNCMPSSVKDRFTVDFEYVYFFTKSGKYWFEQQKEPSVDPESYTGRRKRNKRQCDLTGDKKLMQNFYKLNGEVYANRNRRCVWDIPTTPSPESHFAMFPKKLVETMVLSGCPENGIVLDPFSGMATTGCVSVHHGRNYIGFELNKDYAKRSQVLLNAELAQTKIQFPEYTVTT